MGKATPDQRLGVFADVGNFGVLTDVQKVLYGLLQKLEQTALGAVVEVAVHGVDHIGIGDQSVPIVGLPAGAGHFNQALNAELESIHPAVIHKACGGEAGMLAAELR